jgi:hypothetical protein
LVTFYESHFQEELVSWTDVQFHKSGVQSSASNNGMQRTALPPQLTPAVRPTLSSQDIREEGHVAQDAVIRRGTAAGSRLEGVWSRWREPFNMSAATWEFFQQLDRRIAIPIAVTGVGGTLFAGLTHGAQTERKAFYLLLAACSRRDRQPRHDP